MLKVLPAISLFIRVLREEVESLKYDDEKESEPVNPHSVFTPFKGALLRRLNFSCALEQVKRT